MRNEATALSQAAGPTDVPLLTETIGANFEATVARHGDREALVERWTGRRWTYAELDRDVDLVARGLLAAGLRTGDRVGIWSPNCAEWVLLQYATAKLGVILVNINPAYRTHELAYALNQSECVMLVAARAYKTSQYAEMVAEVADQAHFLKHVVFFGEPGSPDAGLPDAYAAGDLRVTSWTDLLAGADGVEPGRVREVLATLHASDPINIQYTSGTTGYPKGATLSHTNILNNGYFVGEGISMTAEDRLVYPVPLYHCFGMVMSNLACTTHGATMIQPAPTFDAASCLQAVHDERATILHGVPTMFIAEQNLPATQRSFTPSSSDGAIGTRTYNAATRTTTFTWTIPAGTEVPPIGSGSTNPDILFSFGDGLAGGQRITNKIVVTGVTGGSITSPSPPPIDSLVVRDKNQGAVSPDGIY